MLSGVAIAAASLLAAAAMTFLTLRSARSRGLVQAPNERSSHTRPTPTGGGTGIVVGGTIAGLAAAMALGWPAATILAVGLAMAAIGLIDDIRSLPWQVRLGGQVLLFGAATLAVAPDAGPLAMATLFIAGVLWINVFNFMDGIDGLAGSQGAFMALGAAGLVLLTPGGIDQPVAWWLAGLGFACLGFLAFNWPPAKIFMGDVGSTYLGLTIGALAVLSSAGGLLTIWQWLILGAVFASDGLITLGIRTLQRERLFNAHRRHAYQKLSRRFGSHRRVSAGALLINAGWLLPMAALAGIVPGIAWVLCGLAYLPVVALVLYAGAGRREAGEV